MHSCLYIISSQQVPIYFSWVKRCKSRLKFCQRKLLVVPLQGYKPYTCSLLSIVWRRIHQTRTPKEQYFEIFLHLIQRRGIPQFLFSSIVIQYLLVYISLAKYSTSIYAIEVMIKLPLNVFSFLLCFPQKSVTSCLTCMQLVSIKDLLLKVLLPRLLLQRDLNL